MNNQNNDRRAEAQQRKAAWLKRRDERIAQKHHEEMQIALNAMNSNKHFNQGDFKSMSLMELVETAMFLRHPQNSRAADSKMAMAEVLRRAKKRKMDVNMPMEYILTKLLDEAITRECNVEAERKNSTRCKLEKRTIELIKMSGELEFDITNDDGTIQHIPGVAEADYLAKVGEFYTEMLGKSAHFVKVGVWTTDLAKKLLTFLDKWSDTEGDKHWNVRTFSTSDVLDVIAIGASKAVFGF